MEFPVQTPPPCGSADDPRRRADRDSLWGRIRIPRHGGGRRIAFESNRDGDWDIYTMRPDGTDVRQLTADDAWDRDPAWSPDRTWIAFASDRDGDFEIYTMRSDGTDVRQLTADDAWDRNPAWSP